MRRPQCFLFAIRFFTWKRRKKLHRFLMKLTKAVTKTIEFSMVKTLITLRLQAFFLNSSRRLNNKTQFFKSLLGLCFISRAAERNGVVVDLKKNVKRHEYIRLKQWWRCRPHVKTKTELTLHCYVQILSFKKWESLLSCLALLSSNKVYWKQT